MAISDIFWCLFLRVNARVGKEEEGRGGKKRGKEEREGASLCYQIPEIGQGAKGLV